MSNQKEICMKCKEWDYEEMINPYWFDCEIEDCSEFKKASIKMRTMVKQEIDMLIKINPERI